MGWVIIIEYLNKTSKFIEALYLCFLFLNSTFLISQEHGSKFEIENYSFKELMDLQDMAYDNDSLELLYKYIRIHSDKAEKLKNNLELARSFYYYTLLETDSTALIFADSIASLTINSENPYYPTLGYIQKGRIYYDDGQFNKALDNYLLAYNWAIEKGNLEDQRFVSEAIAGIRNVNGQPHEAVNLYNRSLKLLEQEKDYLNDYYQDYIHLVYNLSLGHLRLNQIDSARYYTNNGIFQSLNNKDGLSMAEFKMVGAQIDYFEGNFKKANDTIRKYIDLFEGTEKAIKLYYLGKTENILGNPKNAIEYFKDIDSIVTETNDPFDELKDVYYLLTLNSTKQDLETEQVDYIGKLIKYDSILTATRKHISNSTTIAYDIPTLKLQKANALKSLEEKKLTNRIYLSLLIVAIITAIWAYIRAIRIKNKVKKLLEKPPINLIEETATIEHLSTVPIEIRENILKKLNAFEQNKGFLEKNMDLSSLAQNLDTNTSYLSNIINHYKKLSFPSYIKELRITYAIKKLSKDPELLKYNYQGLADEFGFKTAESFSKAFYAKTKFYPSKLLKELKNRNKGVIYE